MELTEAEAGVLLAAILRTIERPCFPMGLLEEVHAWYATDEPRPVDRALAPALVAKVAVLDLDTEAAIIDALERATSLTVSGEPVIGPLVAVGLVRR